MYSLLMKREALVDHVLPDFEVQEAALFTKIEPLWRILVQMLANPVSGSVYCVVDGLDECDPESLYHLLKKIKLFFRRQAEGVVFKLLLVSREAPPFLVQELAGFPHIPLDARLSILAPGEEKTLQETALEVPLDDSNSTNSTSQTQPHSANNQAGSSSQATVQTPNSYLNSFNVYVQAKVDKLSEILGLPDSEKQKLMTKFAGMSEKSFLWVDMAAKQLLKTPAEQTEAFVETLSTGVDGIYCNILRSIPGPWVNFAVHVLKWVAVGLRPLTVNELRVALEMQLFQFARGTQELVDCLSIFGTMLVLKDGTVSIAHQTVIDILTKEDSILRQDNQLAHFHINVGATHRELGLVCQAYLQNGSLRDPLNIRLLQASPGELNDRLMADRTFAQNRTEAFPLLLYSLQSCTEHLRNATDITFDLNSPLLLPNSPIQMAFLKTHWASVLGREMQFAPTNFFPIHFAAMFDILSLAQQIERTSPNFVGELSRVDGGIQTPLQRAAQANSTHVAPYILHYLLPTGRISLNEEWKEGFTVGTVGGIVAFAAKAGHSEMLQLALDVGWNVNEVTRMPKMKILPLAIELYKNRKSLKEARRHDNVEENGRKQIVDGVHAYPGDGCTMLHLASEYGQAHIVHMMIENGANVDALSDNRFTPLHQAAYRGHEGTIDVLLNAGAEIDARNIKMETPLHLSCIRAPSSAIQILIKRGAIVDARTKKQKTPLQLAAFNNHTVALNILLDNGSGINLVDHKGYTALMVAAFRGHEEAVLCLLGRGAGPNIRANGKKSAADIARNPKIRELIQGYQRNSAGSPLHILPQNIPIPNSPPQVAYQHPQASNSPGQQQYAPVSIPQPQPQYSPVPAVPGHLQYAPVPIPPARPVYQSIQHQSFSGPYQQQHQPAPVPAPYIRQHSEPVYTSAPMPSSQPSQQIGGQLYQVPRKPAPSTFPPPPTSGPPSSPTPLHPSFAIATNFPPPPTHPLSSISRLSISSGTGLSPNAGMGGAGDMYFPPPPKNPIGGKR